MWQSCTAKRKKESQPGKERLMLLRQPLLKTITPIATTQTAMGWTALLQTRHFNLQKLTAFTKKALK